MPVFKWARCSCGKKLRCEKIPKKAVVCACGKAMSVSASWVISWGESGKTKYKTIGTSYEAAVAAERKAYVNVSENNSELNRKPVTPWGEALRGLELHLTSLVTGKKLAHGTKEFYAKNLKNHCTPFFKGMTLDKIDVSTVNAFIRHLQTKTGVVRKKEIPLSTTTINRCVTTLQRLLNWSESEGLVRGNPFSNKIESGHIIRFDEKKRTRFLTEEEVIKFLDACKHKADLYLIVLIALHTGLRRSDVVSLAWHEVDLESGFIHRSRIAKHKMDEGEISSKPLSPKLKEAIADYREKTPQDSRWLFPSPLLAKDQPYGDKAKFGFETVRDKLVSSKEFKPFQFRDLRRSFATHCAKNGIPIETTQELLNHSDIRITRDVYTRIEKGKLTNDFQRFSM